MIRMSNPSFVHLRLHSEYSVSDGIVRLDDAVAAALADGMPALALTDLANMFGMVKFYQEARGKGLKPVIGCDVWLENEGDRIGLAKGSGGTSRPSEQYTDRVKQLEDAVANAQRELDDLQRDVR